MIPVFSELSQIPSDFLKSSVAIGNFDGVHLGHARLIRLLVEQARRLHSRSIVLTFDPPPKALLKPDMRMQPPITPVALRAELLGHLGVDAVVAIPTTLKLLNLTPHEFFKNVMVEQLGVCGIVEGPNFRFGKDRAGDILVLGELCHQYEVALQIVDAENDGSGMISSSRIRKLLSEGNVEQANSMLIRPFRICGVVSKGAGRGRQILVPTANLTAIRSLLPGPGVYGGLVRVDGQPFKTAINIGPNPTFDEAQAKIELHLIGWEGDLYGRNLCCELLVRVRDTRKFGSKDQLLQQIQADIAIIMDRVSISGG